MQPLPIFLSLEGRRCVVAGGGTVASRKVARLVKAGARPVVIAPDLCEALQGLRAEGAIEHIARAFEAGDLHGATLAFAATDNREVNREIAELAEARGALVNCADDPKRCSFIMPSVVDRAPVQIAVSTGGASPVLARLLRARLETLVPSSFGRLAALMGRYRKQARVRFRDTGARRRFWESVLSGPVAEMLFAGQDRAAAAALERALSNERAPLPHCGEVYLVGAGPGDPDLLTFRALRLMQQADVVLYDRLVAQAIVDLARRDAERIFVGKRKDRHALPQGDINGLLVKLAREGKRVLRLKGGDPFIFGRGGEEIESLAAEGIPFQVVPGITAAAGCASYAGIPLTHRDFAQSCLFVTGHLKDGSMDLNWDALIQPQQTVAVYMGVTGARILCGELLARGMRENMPVALVEQATTPQQRVYVTTLAGLPEVIDTHKIQPPSMIIIGEVVRLHEKLAWFEPLAATGAPPQAPAD